MVHYLAKPPEFSAHTGSNVAVMEMAHFTDLVDQDSWKNFHWFFTLEI